MHLFVYFEKFRIFSWLKTLAKTALLKGILRRRLHESRNEFIPDDFPSEALFLHV